MAENFCAECNHDKSAPDGLCTKRKGSDGLVLRCVGYWTWYKHFYLERYIDAFTKATRAKWKARCYIDLFSGPGLCMRRDTENEIEGSPLISMRTKCPFDKYVFIEKNSVAVQALKERLKGEGGSPNTHRPGRIEIIEGDCNALAELIASKIPAGSLSLAFMDQAGLDLHFETIKLLAANERRIDLIINVPIGTTINRNIKQFSEAPEARKMDAFWGDSSWRDFYRRLTQGVNDDLFDHKLLKEYRRRLQTLDFKYIDLGEEKKIKHFYYLVFVSKHKFGYELWKKVNRENPDGQMEIKL